MRLGHFETLRPVCPRCRAAGAAPQPLRLTLRSAVAGEDILEGLLECPEPGCRLEFPIIDGIPIILRDVAAFVAAALPEIRARDDLGPEIESLLCDAAGPGSAYATTRHYVSTYAWDGYAAQDPAEPAGEPAPGAVLRCLDALIELAGARPEGPVLDLGCAVGASSFALAERTTGLVLGIDLNFAMLRLARRVLATGRVSYPRRRIGLVYDRRDFAVACPGAERVDFWACDVLALPFAAATAGTVAALNLLDCVSSPIELLSELGRVLKTGGQLLLATPYDWSAATTAPPAWIGGHSQRGGHGGAAEPLLADLLTPGAHPQSVLNLRLRAERQDWPWHTRLHDRSTVAYRVHLVAAEGVAV